MYIAGSLLAAKKSKKTELARLRKQEREVRETSGWRKQVWC